MKRVLLAVAIASVCGGASAATVYKGENGDYTKIYGGMEVGGFLVADEDETPFKKDGKWINENSYVDKSFMTLGAKGQTGDFFAKFELDAERDTRSKDNNYRLVIDKAFIGYKLPNDKGSLEFGRTDTAYDHYDGFGDYSNELAFGISEAGDQDHTVKYRGQFGNIKVGASHSLEGKDSLTDWQFGAVSNAYVGYFADNFTVIGAAESADGNGDIVSIHAEYKMDKLAIGGFISDSNKDDKDSSTTTFLGSISYKLTDSVKGYAVTSRKTSEANIESKEDQIVVVGAEYKPARNIKLVAEVSFGQEKTSELGFVKAYYWF